MTAMCLDLSFINKFLIAWGIFLTIAISLHVIMLAVYCAASLFPSDNRDKKKNNDDIDMEDIQKYYIDSVIDFLLALSLVGLFYYLGMKS
jgi:hypothetical protein